MGVCGAVLLNVLNHKFIRYDFSSSNKKKGRAFRSTVGKRRRQFEKKFFILSIHPALFFFSTTEFFYFHNMLTTVLVFVFAFACYEEHFNFNYYCQEERRNRTDCLNLLKNTEQINKNRNLFSFLGELEFLQLGLFMGGFQFNFLHNFNSD